MSTDRPRSEPRPAVLLVEDDPTNQMIALSMLRHVGIEADSASDGEVGVRMATERDYDVVLMDIQMPRLDGVSAMKAIRERLPAERRPRIVAVTAHAVVGTREEMLAAGFDGFYNKPLSIAAIQEAISEKAKSDATPAMVARRAPEAPDHASGAALLADVRAHVQMLLGEEDEDFAVDLAGSFATTAREAIGAADQAQQAGDAEGVARAAHTLKGSASNVGLSGLADAWGAIELGVRTGDTAVLGAPLAAALAETERVAQGLADTVA